MIIDPVSYPNIKRQRDVTIKVTASDIARGIPNNCVGCPIYLAIKRLLSSEYDVRVNRTTMTITKSSKPLIVMHHDRKVSEFIYSFDTDFTVRPMSFTISLPIDCLNETSRGDQ